MNDWQKGELIELDDEFRQMGYYMPQTDAQRRAAADARKRDQGLTRVSVWVPVESAAEIKREAQRLVAESRQGNT